MRLGTCIALELAAVAGTVGGAWYGAHQLAPRAAAYLETRPVEAATSHPVTTPEPLPHAHLAVTIPPVATVFGAPDDELLAPLGAAAVTGVRVNRGGLSLSLRLDFANGSRAAFKPEQIWEQSDPRREIAAYRVDRLLGLGRVPPAKAIELGVAELVAAAQPDHQTFIARRLADEAIVHDGLVRGELSWWVPEITVAKLGRQPIDDHEGRDLWTAYLQVGTTIPDDARVMTAQIAAVILFDVLIDNPDRWTGANTMMSPDGEILYFMDNTLSFSHLGFGHLKNLTALRRISVFPRGLVTRLRSLTAEALSAALTGVDDRGLGPLVSEDEIRAMLTRRDNMLRYIDRLIDEHGAAAVLALP